MERSATLPHDLAMPFLLPLDPHLSLFKYANWHIGSSASFSSLFYQFFVNCCVMPLSETYLLMSNCHKN